MTEEKKIYYRIIAQKTVKNLKKNNFEAYFFENSKDAKEHIISNLKENSTIGVGGSKTLDELELLEVFRQKKYNFFDRYDNTKTREELEEIKRKALLSDFFFFSSNAITENGELVNIDGSGNRLAALIYGPKNVYIICGINKITKNIEKALERVRDIAAPMNSIRLNRKTPCVVTAHCENCSSNDRICSNIVITEKIMFHQKGRVKVYIINEELGF